MTSHASNWVVVKDRKGRVLGEGNRIVQRGLKWTEILTDEQTPNGCMITIVEAVKTRKISMIEEWFGVMKCTTTMDGTLS